MSTIVTRESTTTSKAGRVWHFNQDVHGPNKCLYKLSHIRDLVQGVDEVLPVDVYLSGCPPRPESLIEGLMEIQRKITRGEQPASVLSRGSSEPTA